MANFQVLVAYSLLFSLIPSFHALDTIAPGKSFTSNETLVSADGTFEAGFFSVDSERQFLGIWYKNISPRTYVWVANRDAPLENSSGVLQVTNGGTLVILNSTGATVWNSSASTTAGKNPVAQLMDTGNLVVRDANSDDILWQCFDYPADTLLAGMKLRTNRLTGEHTSTTSWRNTQDPSPGDYSLHIDTRGFPQAVISKGGQLMYRVGSWNGKLFSGVPWERLSTYFRFSLVITQEEVIYGYELLDSTMVTRYTVSLSGFVERYTWSNQTQRWEIFSAGPADQCDNYASCGPNSNCDTSKSPICECLNGFVPKFQEKWDSNNRVDGCVRRTNLSCNNEDGFLKNAEMKLPDTSSSWYDENMNLEECKQECLKNCSCSAYANLYVNDGGSGCLLWFDDIVDTRIKTSEGQDLYVRLTASELDDINNDSQLNKKQIAGILVGCILFATGIVILGGILYKRRKKIQKQGIIIVPQLNLAVLENNDLNQAQHEEMDVPMFDLATILNATNCFSISNKLGEGGFGPVYKGVLANGQEIAVKRLSRSSGQGLTEFKNEAVLFANLQHRNLVKLLGCCIQNDERLLIYEFMPNRSLDNFIFDQTRSDLLHWTRRFQIVNGIARGLLYLHQDSRLKIIHRDLKTSNILLDKNMNPKISDFGLARIFVVDEAEAKTKRVVGTYGYMPPEYAVRGSFSVKSDVFSFGVIMLEIVSGRKNREFFDATHRFNLLGHAWRLWNEERPLELIDESLGDSVTPAEVLRCIHVGLLCVQERPEDRPNMSSVVLMLNGEKSLPHPREPGFYPHEETSSGKYSTNEISISLLDAR